MGGSVIGGTLGVLTPVPGGMVLGGMAGGGAAAYRSKGFTPGHAIGP